MSRPILYVVLCILVSETLGRHFSFENLQNLFVVPSLVHTVPKISFSS